MTPRPASASTSRPTAATAGRWSRGSRDVSIDRSIGSVAGRPGQREPPVHRHRRRPPRLLERQRRPAHAAQRPDARHLRVDRRRRDLHARVQPAAEPGPARGGRRLVPGRREQDARRPGRPHHGLRRDRRLRHLAPRAAPRRRQRLAPGVRHAQPEGHVRRPHGVLADAHRTGTRGCTRATAPTTRAIAELWRTDQADQSRQEALQRQGEPGRLDERCPARRTARRASRRTTTARTGSAATTTSSRSTRRTRTSSGSAARWPTTSWRRRAGHALERARGRALDDAGVTFTRHDRTTRARRPEPGCTPTSTRSCSTRSNTRHRVHRLRRRRRAHERHVRRPQSSDCASRNLPQGGRRERLPAVAVLDPAADRHAERRAAHAAVPEPDAEPAEQRGRRHRRHAGQRHVGVHRARRTWFESIGGDGGQSAIDFANPNLRAHTYFDADIDVNHQGNDVDTLGLRLRAARRARLRLASFYIPLIGDPKVSGTMFAGLQHVWRTTDWGGDPATLDAKCRNVDPLGFFPSDAGVRRLEAARRRPDRRRRSATAAATTSWRPSAPRPTRARCGRRRASGACSSPTNADAADPTTVDVGPHRHGHDAGALRQRHLGRPDEPQPRLGLLLGLQRLHARTRPATCSRSPTTRTSHAATFTGPLVRPRRRAGHRRRARPGDGRRLRVDRLGGAEPRRTAQRPG